ncbi:hypothetical protein PRZ48_000914 [Zasmidium cellare]|uniref:Heterokaryon incompatibility domain-containing protein n=1 Tax=Zasmidium cellare TaxID=395010 RepID=A0ABR0F1J1_ZASCE|nr:hypothetical protein PRZ48_000914 [Zasmidium cellare]
MVGFSAIWLKRFASYGPSERVIVDTASSFENPSPIAFQGGFVAATPITFVAILAIYMLDVTTQMIAVPKQDTKWHLLRKTTDWWYGIENRALLRYKLYRMTLVLVEVGGAAALSFYLFRLYPKALFATGSPFAPFGPWMCYLLFCLAVLNLVNTAISILASSEWIAFRLYGKGVSVDLVQFHSVVERRTRLEQSYYSQLDPARSTTNESFVYAPPSTVLPGEHLKGNPDSTSSFPACDGVDHFVRCGCCVDANDMVPLSPSGRARPGASEAEDDTRHGRQIAAWAAHRELILRTRSECPLERLVDDEQDLFRQHHKLCQTCTYFSFNLERTIRSFGAWHSYWTDLSPRKYRLLEHAASPQDLVQSSVECHLCSIIWNALNAEQQQSLLRHDIRVVEEATASGREASSKQRDQLHLRRCIKIGVKSDIWLNVHYGGLRRPRAWLKLARGHSEHLVVQQLAGKEKAPAIALFWALRGGKYDTIPRKTGSELTIRLVREWLQGLAIDHRQESTWLPTRVLDVSGDDHGIIRVIGREEIDATSNPRYVALSHCWGSLEFATYDATTQNDFHRGFPVSALPRTFRDAIDFTRRLKVRYLWVDSLCILQGNAEDWNKEAPTMCRVYMSAYITLAAIPSWGAMEGIYREHEPLPFSRCLLDGNRLEKNNDKPGLMSFCARPFKVVEDADLARNEIGWSKWRTRGWTLQEALLSPRIVYLTSTSVVFEAKDVNGGQTVGERIIPEHLSGWLSSEDSRKKYEPTQDWQRTWWDWVGEFTHRQLTKSSDRAMAILGLAQYMSACTAFQTPQHCRYLAGLWESNMVAELLWYVRIGTSTRPETFRAPSWSWISVDGSIDNQSLLAKYNTGLEIEEVNAILPSPIDAAPPNAGIDARISPRLAEGSYIQVRGKLRSLTSRGDAGTFYYNHDASFNYQTLPELESNAVLGVMAHASGNRIGPRCYPLHMDGLEKTVGWYIPDTKDPVVEERKDVTSEEKEKAFEGSKQLHCLLINVEPEQQAKRQDFTQTWVKRGLALQAVQVEAPSGEVIPAYKRVGFFELIFQSTGVFAPMDGWNDWGKYPLRAKPITDPFHVFDNEDFQSIRIY